MPDKEEIHLPDYSWKLVQDKFTQEQSQSLACGTKCSQSTFSRAYNSVPHIKVRKVKRFSQCNWCSQLKHLIRNSTEATKIFWENELRHHNDWQMRERLKQARHVQKAANPSTTDDYMVMMIDNMDHAKSSLPHMPRPPKDLDSAEKLHTHITGIHVPGWKERPITCYTWHDRFPTGSDSVITFVLKTLCELAKAHDGKLPPKLYLHMGNCWRENKNRYVLGVAHLLVHMGCFKRVDLCFPPVGHTHNIVDQMFSRFSMAMKDQDFYTVDDIHRICRDGYRTAACICNRRFAVKKTSLVENAAKCTCPEVQVHFEHIDEMACWGPLLQDCMTNNIKGISKPRYFRVQRDADGVVRHHYRSQLQTPKNQDEGERNANAGCSQAAIQV